MQVVRLIANTLVFVLIPGTVKQVKVHFLMNSDTFRLLLSPFQIYRAVDSPFTLQQLHEQL